MVAYRDSHLKANALFHFGLKCLETSCVLTPFVSFTATRTTLELVHTNQTKRQATPQTTRTKENAR